MACKGVIARIDLRETDMCEIIELSIIRILGEGRSVFFFVTPERLENLKRFQNFSLNKLPRENALAHRIESLCFKHSLSKFGIRLRQDREKTQHTYRF